MKNLRNKNTDYIISYEGYFLYEGLYYLPYIYSTYLNIMAYFFNIVYFLKYAIKQLH